MGDMLDVIGEEENLRRNGAAMAERNLNFPSNPPHPTTLTMNSATFNHYDRCARGMRPCLVVLDDHAPANEIRVEAAAPDPRSDGVE